MIGPSRRMVVLAVAGAVAIAPVISGCGAGMRPQSAAPTQLTDGVNVSVPKDEPGAAQIDLRNMFLLGPRPGTPVPPGTSLALYGVMINQVKGRQDRLVSVSSPLFGTARVDGGGLVLPPATPDGTGSVVKLLGKASRTPASTPDATAPGGGTEQPGATTSRRPSAPATTQEPTGSGATREPTGGATPQNTAGGQNTAAPQNTAGAPNTAGAQPSGSPVTPGGEQPLVVLTGLRQQLLAGVRVPVRMQFEKAGAVEFTVPLVPQQDEYNAYPLASPIGQAPGAPGGGHQPTTGAEPTQGGTPQQHGATPPAPGGGH